MNLACITDNFETIDGVNILFGPLPFGLIVILSKDIMGGMKRDPCTCRAKRCVGMCTKA